MQNNMTKIYYNNWLAKLILWDDYSTIMLFGFILTKRKSLSEKTLNHEAIHVTQYKECFVLGLILMTLSGLFIPAWWLVLVPLFLYYLMYVIEWIARLFKGNAYRNISFEREAYGNQDNLGYLKSRKVFASFRYYNSKLK